MKFRISSLLFIALLTSACSSPDVEDVEPINLVVPDPDLSSSDDFAPSPDMGASEDVIDEPVLEFDLATGAHCSIDAQCQGGTCLIGENFPQGFCTTIDCDDDCGSPNERCVDSALGTFCAPTCQTNEHCREGQACGSLSPQSPESTCVPITGQPDGTECNDDTDCQSDRCRGGFCRNRCTEDADCFAFGDVQNVCLEFQPGRGVCLETCEQDSECDSGEICESITFDVSICNVDDTRPIDPTVISNSVFDFTCVQPMGNTALPFEVAPETSSYQVTPLNIDGSNLTPIGIDLPSGGFVDFSAGANAIQSIPSLIYGGMNPTVVPAHSGLSSQLESGAHTYQVDSNADQLCFFKVEESTPGTILDVNFYFVAVPGLNSANAETHVDFQSALTEFNEIFQPAGFSIRTVRYFDILGDDAARLAVPQNDQEIVELVSLSTPPGPSVDDALSINVFFVQSFGIPGGAIGISEGLPGPAGLHGTHGSGVAFTSEFLGQQSTDGITGQAVDGNELTAQVMAHEIGHYLGLFHTSEQTGNQHDPLSDTPQCFSIGADCPDLTNLMFPFAGVSHTTITPEQAFVIGAHPLTKSGVSQ